MRVALDGRQFFQRTSGVSLYSVSLTRALAATRPDLDLLLLHAGGEVAARGGLAQGRWVRVNAPGYLWKQVGVPWALGRFRVDLFHATSGGVPIASPCRIVATIHDLLAEIDPSWLPRTIRFKVRATARLNVRRADRLIAVSESTKRDLVELYRVAPTAVDVIPNAVGAEFGLESDPTRLAEIRGRYHLPARPFILFVGTLFRWRNIPRLIAAHRILIDRGIDADLVLAGRNVWGDRAVDEALAANGTADRVRRLGFVRDDDLPGLYRLAAVFAYPSLHEGFGIPPLEAMASGVPVVSSAVSSLPEVVGDAGLLVDPRSVEQLADALGSVFEDERLRQDLAVRGRLRARQFSWDDVARRTAAVYERVLG
jgi:glycosyltransferase involved in cell wall biosynthesis